MTSYLTPPQVAERLAVDVAKVRAWIRRGDLRAINVGDGPSRPRFRVSPADLAAFEAARSASPSPRAPRRRRRGMDHVIQFFK